MPTSNLLIFALLIFVCSRSVFAQNPVYEPFAVDSIAAPRGGASMLETFLAVNVRKPFMAQVANATGKVFVKAIVEPNGRISEVTLLRGFRPDCDAEALRVMRLFNAWKPAIKDGQPVRQAITYPVFFRANALVRYVDGQLIELFDAKYTLLNTASQTEKPVYQQRTPIDTLTGLPNGDLTVYEIYESGSPNKRATIPLIKLQNPRQQGGEVTFRLGHKDPANDWAGTVYTLREDGSVSRRASAELLKGPSVSYDKRGMVESIRQGDEQASTTTWQPNGLPLKMEQKYKGDPKVLKDYIRLMAAWDSTGQQLVKDGNGYYKHIERQKSRGDSTQETTFIEEGDYKDGLKDGQWTGRFSDGSYSYTEQYKMGEDLGGIATLPTGKTISYKAAWSNPCFMGGTPAMYRYLGQTINYPVDAQRKNVTGKVFISFVVCTDGSLCDYNVLQGVYPSVDAEALRTVRRMPNWKPGSLRGEPIRVQFSLPVSFQLE